MGVDPLEEAALEALGALEGWEEWEAKILLNDGCWGPSGECDIQDHLEALAPLQDARNKALAAVRKALGFSSRRAP